MTEPTFAETRRLFVRLGRWALRASWAFGALANRLLAPELGRIDQ